MIDERTIKQPKKIKKKDDSDLTIFFYSDGATLPETMLVRGGICFPMFDKRENKFKGAISVCAVNVDTGLYQLLYLETFEWYTFPFWEKLNEIYEKYGVNQFYYNEKQTIEARKLMGIAKDNIEAGKKYKYPYLTHIGFASDFYAYSTLFQKITEKNFIFSGKSTFLTASVLWDEQKPFIEAPVEMQVVCTNLYGIDRDLPTVMREEMQTW